MFGGLIGLADTQSPGIKPATQRHTASPATDRSGWKFPVIQRMPSHSALLQSTFPYGTHTHTHTHTHIHGWLTVRLCVSVCVCVWTRTHISLAAATFIKTEREILTRVPLTQPAYYQWITADPVYFRRLWHIPAAFSHIITDSPCLWVFIIKAL